MIALIQQAPGDLALRDIHLPPIPSWWPPAPGWWMLFGLLCTLLAAAFLIYRRVRRERIWRQGILAEIPRLAARHSSDDVAYATSLHQLLRRVACLYAVDAQRLQGDRWRDVLAQVPTDATTLDTLMALEARMYRPHVDFDRGAAQDAAQRWLQSALQHAKALIRKSGHA